jgi:hypothetical protein
MTNDRFIDVMAEEEQLEHEQDPHHRYNVDRNLDLKHSVINESLNEVDSPTLRSKNGGS